MQEESLIAVSEFCTVYQIEFSFVSSLNDYGLIEIIKVGNNEFITGEQLVTLEKVVRLHDELGINIEGIETISYLLEKMNKLQNELNDLKNRLRLYEDFD